MAWTKPADWTLSVSDLNEYVRKSLAADPMLRGIRLRGEISGLKRHSSGHLYFTLKDEGARIAAVMFRQQAMALDFRPQDGQQVVAEGSVSLYAAAGQYQFYCDGMQPEGQGDLFLRFERLKDKLMREGLFDPSLKKPLPAYARRVGIVTSPTGAVVHDIQTVAARRDPSVQLTLCPVNVQGGAAAGEIAHAIARMDRMGFDVLIVGRGGGSLEDLWAFNEEIVARAIAACHTPVISAVGHEVDFTIADFVADVRAATPSVAAELAVADREELRRGVESMRARLDRLMELDITRRAALLDRQRARLEASGPRKRMDVSRVRLEALMHRLHAAGEGIVPAQRAMLDALQARLAGASPAGRIELARQRAAQCMPRLDAAARHCVQAQRSRLDAQRARLEALSPERVLGRGYAIVSARGAAVSGVKDVQPGDMLTVRMRGGSISALTVDIDETEK